MHVLTIAVRTSTEIIAEVSLRVRSVRARSAKNFNNFSSSRFYCVTQITRISLVSLTYTARTPLENQRSDVNSIMTKT